MKAYVIETAGGPEVLQLREIDARRPNADEVRIRVRAFGLNRAELYRRSGRMGPITGQVVPGIEAVGEVLEDPSGTFHAGQRVATATGGMQVNRPGSYAEEVTVLRSNVVDLDGTTLGWEELASLPLSYLTVWGALGRLIDTAPKLTVLVRGASAAVGQAAVAYAKARGQTVLATTRSLENTARLKAIGADAVIIDSGSVAEQVRAAAPQGVDVALDVVGAGTVLDTARSVSAFGTTVVIGLMSGMPVLEQLDLARDLPNAVRLAFFSSSMLGSAALPLDGAPLRWMADRQASGATASLRVQTFAFGDVPRAHRLMESNGAQGKLVVLM
ncbi:zinc-binding dehydrogenase [Massilia sp. S19_KUP03_FR1]|uniref:zinc-binding dehydrogenase n=1 Tax=Massilia sp. S19_KUP03_FR1 TaxID=3025503 RepID=UPI002FCDBEF6